jgi:hypothetical protein
MMHTVCQCSACTCTSMLHIWLAAGPRLHSILSPKACSALQAQPQPATISERCESTSRGGCAPMGSRYAGCGADMRLNHSAAARAHPRQCAPCLAAEAVQARAWLLGRGGATGVQQTIAVLCCYRSGSGSSSSSSRRQRKERHQQQRCRPNHDAHARTCPKHPTWRQWAAQNCETNNRNHSGAAAAPPPTLSRRRVFVPPAHLLSTPNTSDAPSSVVLGRTAVMAGSDPRPDLLQQEQQLHRSCAEHRQRATPPSCLAARTEAVWRRCREARSCRRRSGGRRRQQQRFGRWQGPRQSGQPATNPSTPHLPPTPSHEVNVKVKTWNRHNKAVLHDPIAAEQKSLRLVQPAPTAALPTQLDNPTATPLARLPHPLYPASRLHPPATRCIHPQPFLHVQGAGHCRPSVGCCSTWRRHCRGGPLCGQPTRHACLVELWTNDKHPVQRSGASHVPHERQEYQPPQCPIQVPGTVAARAAPAGATSVPAGGCARALRAAGGGKAAAAAQQAARGRAQAGSQRASASWCIAARATSSSPARLGCVAARDLLLPGCGQRATFQQLMPPS